MHVLLFSGGRGSGALARQLVSTPNIALTVVINGYDDGASTGEVRRFLGDSLGPSDFRKNAFRLAAELRTCPAELIDLLDARLPEDSTSDAASARLREIASADERIRARVERFLCELRTSGGAFDFRDCSIGNIVFAGGFLLCGRDFNRAVDDYVSLVGLPPGLVENVSSGENAYLAALDADGGLLATEEEIVDTGRPSRVREIFLIDRPITADEHTRVSGAAAESLLRERTTAVRLNPRLAPRIAAADLIIYAPGTQHSSLFPSYLTSGLSTALAANLKAIKLLVTNIQTDAEIAGTSAVDLIDRAVYYLEEKGRLAIPTPCLITHYLVNDPGRGEPERAYVPLGQIDSIEDPRLVRIANYEEGVSGRHDAARVLTPFLQTIADRASRKRVAVLLQEAHSANKLAQTLLEMVRGGAERLPIDLTVFANGVAPLEPSFAASLPFPIRQLAPGKAALDAALTSERFDYVAVFDSSGMYRGEDIVGLASHLPLGRLDAVWGSRRLSIRDIEESYRLRYRHNVLLGAISYVGSHMLSLAYLILYGRYITDTLSPVWAVRAADAVAPDVNVTAPQASHLVLSRLLRRKAEILEVPVHFLPLSPERVNRTTPLDGLRALATILRQRFLGTR